MRLYGVVPGSLCARLRLQRPIVRQLLPDAPRRLSHRRTHQSQEEGVLFSSVEKDQVKDQGGDSP